MRPFHKLLAARFLRDRSGATVVEYGLICLLIFLAVVTAIHTFAGNAGNMYNRISNAITNAT